jgi:hypothetical protein
MATLPALAAALADLRAAADELDQLDDQLTALIPEVEAALRDLRLGVRISVDIPTAGDHERCLAFDRHGQGWRLVIDEGPPDEPDLWTTTALASAPRDERALVFEHYLEELVVSAAKQIKDKAEDRRRTLSGTKDIVATLKQAAPARKAKS